MSSPAKGVDQSPNSPEKVVGKSVESVKGQVGSERPEVGSHDTGGNQQSDGGQSSLCSITERTLANIKRLQENVTSSGTGVTMVSTSAGVSTVWVGNHQNSENVVQQPQGSPCPIQLELTSPPPTTSSAGLATPPQSPLPCISPSLSSSFNALVTIDPSWQSSKKSLRERNAVMCNNALMADVYFNVGAETNSAPKKFPAHKYVLATGSTVFYAMFYGGFAEVVDVVQVPDVEPVAFLNMLKYLYCDEISLCNDNVLATLYCAKKYIVPHLAKECVKFLESRLTAKNACVLLSQSRLFEEPELMERSWEVIDAQAELALLSESFADVDFDTLKLVLSRERLNCKETVVFQAAQDWASTECKRRSLEDTSEKRREVLGNAMQLIRFPAMCVQDFADEVVKTDILTLQETTDIFLHFTAKEKPDLTYPSNPRVGLQKQVCHRFQSSAYRSNQWRYRGRCDSIQFCVDRRIFIIGFGLYGSSNGSSDYTAKIELKSQGRRSPLGENSCRFVSDGSSNTFHVSIKKQFDFIFNNAILIIRIRLELD